MTLKSKRSILSILSGMAVCLLFTIFSPAKWLAPIFGIATTLYIAKVSTAKQGALFGALVPIPAGIYAAVLSVISIQQTADHPVNFWSLFLGAVIGVIFLMLAGTIFGLILGKMIQHLTKKDPILL